MGGAQPNEVSTKYEIIFIITSRQAWTILAINYTNVSIWVLPKSEKKRSETSKMSWIVPFDTECFPV